MKTPNSLSFKLFQDQEQEHYYSSPRLKMNQEAGCNIELELKLNITPSLDSSLVTESSTSSLSLEEGESGGGIREAKSMVVVGCPNCIMYIIISLDNDPRCPRCNNHVLLDFLNSNHSKKNTI